jgi:hypothetical protein
MLLGMRHLISKDTLQRRQTPAGFLQFDEPSLTVGHTGDAVGHTDLRNAAELVGKTADRPHAFTEIPLYLFLSHGEGLLQNFLHFKACIKFCCLYDEGSISKVKDSKMNQSEVNRDRFEASLGDTVLRWLKPRMDWEVADALAAPVYKYIQDTIETQKGRAVCGDIVEGEFAVSVCPYDTNTLDPLFETAPLLLSDIILKYVEIFETADEAFAAIAVSIENARKKVEMLDD